MKSSYVKQSIITVIIFCTHFIALAQDKIVNTKPIPEEQNTWYMQPLTWVGVILLILLMVVVARRAKKN